MKKRVWQDPLFYSGLLLSVSIVTQDVAYALKDGFHIEDIAFISRAVAVQVITTLALMTERRTIIGDQDGEPTPEQQKKLLEAYKKRYGILNSDDV